MNEDVCAMGHRYEVQQVRWVDAEGAEVPGWVIICLVCGDCRKVNPY